MRYAIWYQTLKNGVRMFSQNAFLTSRLFTNVCYFYYHPNIATSKPRSLTTLFSTKMKGEETQSQEHQHPCLSNLS